MKLNDVRMHEIMGIALDEAKAALAAGEFPVGAVVIRGDEIIARAHNLREETHDPTAHAEILAMRAAAQALGDWRMSDCTMVVTLEPCAMCSGAIMAARFGGVIFGAYDPERGCCASVYRIPEDPAFNSFVPSVGGVMAEECAAVINEFLRAHRN